MNDINNTTPEEKTEEKNNDLLQDTNEDYSESGYDNRYSHKTAKDYVNSNTWIVSFTDIMALMLTFFVLLYSMSSPEQNKWKEMTSGIQKQLNRSINAPYQSGVQESIEIAKINFKEALDLNYLSAIINDLIEENENLSEIKTNNLANGLAISIPENILFAEEKSDISEEGSKILHLIAGKLHRIKNRIEIVGYGTKHNVLTAEQNAPEHWSLPMNRAIAISSILYKNGYKNPLTIRSFHEKNIYTDKDDTKQKESSYIDIVVMSDDGSIIR